MEQDIQSDHSDIALYCIYYSIYLIRSQSKNKSYLLQAKEYLLKSLEIYQNIYSYDHRAISLLFTRLSLLSFDLNYSRDAIRYLQNSLEMKSCLYGTKHPYLGRDFNRLACILSLQKDYINAIVYHIAAIQSFQSTLGDHHIETILAYGNLGITLISDGKINNGMNILHDVLYCLFHAGTSLCHPWIQYFSSYLETFNDTTSSGSTRTSTVTSGAGTLPMEKDDKFINLISIDKIKSLNTSMTISFLFTSLNYDHGRGETSPSSSSASLSPPSPPISITVMDPNPAHKLDFYSKNSQQSLALSPKESIHSSHPPSHDLGPISDQNRLPYAALVLTE